MAVGRVERGEVVEAGFDLGAIGHRVAHPEKDLLNLKANLSDGVQRTKGEVVARQGHIGAVGEQRTAHGFALKRGVAGIERGFDGLAGGVAILAHPTTILRGQRADRSQHLGERRLTTHKPHAGLLKGI